MLNVQMRYTEAEVKKMLASAVILVDTREKVNAHVTEYFDQNNIPYKSMKLDTGDYSIMLPKNEELEVQRDLYVPIVIERKASIDELIGNFLADKRTAFQNELIRSQETDFVLLVEQKDGYEDILNHKYRSTMKPASVIGMLKAYEARYRFNTIFIDKKLSPVWIYHQLIYKLRDVLKQL